MGLFSKKKEARAAEVATQTSEDKILRGLLSSASEMSVEKAMNIPAIAGSVNFIANIIAMLPIKLYEENADHTETKEIKDDIRLKLLNEDTNDLLSAYQMKRAIIRDYLLSGGGYVYVNRYGNKVVSLNYVDNSVVFVAKNADPIKKDARLLVGAGAYFPYEFIIMARNTKDGVTGTGVVAENPEMLTGIYNMIVFEKQLVRNGGSRKGFLESERKLAKEEMDLLREKWEELYSDYSNGVMILNNGIKFVQASSSSVEMQLNENKQTNSRLIYGLFNLSEQVVTGTAGDEENSSAVKVAIVPIIKELEEAVNRACLLEDEKEYKYFACDTTELLKGDILKRYQAYQVGLNANFLQPDEVRYKEDLPSLGLDFIKLGLNDVLYNPKTKEVYTPNTNQTTNIDEKNSGNVLQNDDDSGIINEKRFNHNHDPKNGRFISVSNGKGGHTTISNEEYRNLCQHLITYKSLLKDGSINYCYIAGDYYGFSVVMPGTYNFFLKISGSEKELIKEYQDEFND